MIRLVLVFFILFAYTESFATLQNRAATCGSPDKDGYTIVQDPFLGDIDHEQPGIVFTTDYGEDSLRWFMVYQNAIDFKPYRAMKIPSNTTVLIDLTSSCRTFAGRLVRGADINFNGGVHNLGTWTELSWENYPLAYGGVSVIEGNDGPVLFHSEDTSAPVIGFSHDIIPKASKKCQETKDSGGMALKPTDKNGYDEATRKYTKRALRTSKVSIDKSYTATTMSHNGRFMVKFLHGNH
ncbi:hypothetical protein FLAG1_06896 [Fusarium langsethiae]|uniref:Uncharacterized protein n=1 Tax=Fusarium langsethiae TaxID=179993 RepID=A0A0N0V6F3_FUSLA|nr:hypothetical protein FLAG1_06896 [Fusarium langsethiae]GKU04294.1 unnamed protein product [Fusarium langsethiae]